MVQLPDLVQMASLILRLGQTFRITQDGAGQREADTTHSMMLALIAGELAKEEHLNRDRVVVLALVHDLVEVYEGDTPTLFPLTEEEKAQKRQKETEALQRLKGDLKAFPWVLAALDAYTAQEEPEAQFVRLVDKIMPKLTHFLNQCAVPKAMGMTCRTFQQHHDDQCQELQVRYPQFQRTHARLREACEQSVVQWGSVEREQ